MDKTKVYVNNQGLGIADVERETGLTKDQLRVWEKRYGFPTPSRDPNGDRRYSEDEVGKLNLIRRLLDRGLRPGRLHRMTVAALEALSCEGEIPERNASQDLALYLLKTHQTEQLRRELGEALLREGMFRFVTDIAAPLAVLVGDAWMRGDLRVFEEHLFTEILQGQLRGAIAQLGSAGGTPRMLITTLPAEQHGLGVLMAEAICTLEGAECVALGPQTPAADITAAAAAKEVDVVALSFSANFPVGQITEGLAALREALPGRVAIWCGGAGTMRAKRIPEGVARLATLEALGPAIAQWRLAHRHHAPDGA